MFRKNKPLPHSTTKGFSLIELLIVVSILGIVSAIAIPAYRGYIDTSRVTAVQNGLRTIYVQQQEYFSKNNRYYSTGNSCTDNTTTINTTLFSGTKVLDNTYFRFCILQSATSNFTARAEEISGSGRAYTVDNNNTSNF